MSGKKERDVSGNTEKKVFIKQGGGAKMAEAKVGKLCQRMLRGQEIQG